MAEENDIQNLAMIQGPCKKFQDFGLNLVSFNDLTKTGKTATTD